ncbi:XPG protein [Dictyocaulus viviparus]|uniref:XPG protein n=2 Tax=Dictyocaulus viviparus TaxID=29172 RepID=A0A0D8Y2S7_DICVI|nr:XPG protein [Dictyocaulus viviparus]
MGISGLWPILEPTCQPVRLEVLEGKVLAVDVSIWIYQAQLGYPGDVRCPHLALLVSRLCKLLYYKIKPIFVFDGLSVPSMKKKVLNERRLRKHAEEVNLTSTKKRHLLDFATIASLVAYIRYTCTYCFDFYMECYFACSQTQVEIEAIKTKLAAENSKRNRIENNLFDILPGKPIELLDVNDDDDVVLTKKMCYDTSGANPIESLIEERERIRAARLRPSQVRYFQFFVFIQLLCIRNRWPTNTLIVS